jgi:hypothetical protein
MHCFFSRIRCCGNMITEPLSSNGRLALPPLLRLSGVISHCSLLKAVRPEYPNDVSPFLFLRGLCLQRLLLLLLVVYSCFLTSKTFFSSFFRCSFFHRYHRSLINLITFLTLILGTNYPQSFFHTMLSLSF